MSSYALYQPETLPEALDLLAAHGDEDTHVIAGGTSMVLLMNMGLVQPEHVIALRKIPGLRGITVSDDGGLTIGALATHRQLELAPEVRAYAPALSETFGQVATVRIRNQATVGGNLVHADPAQDPPPMLIALDASVTVRSQAGERTPAGRGAVRRLSDHPAPAGRDPDRRAPAVAPARHARHLPEVPAAYARRLRHRLRRRRDPARR
jgi:carbon-monoxide dehydrogenase medium subunit